MNFFVDESLQPFIFTARTIEKKITLQTAKYTDILGSK